MAGTIVLPCKCKSEFQDKQYGTQNRLHNLGEGNKKAYCTVCVGNGRNAKFNSKSGTPTTARDFKNV